MKKALLIVCAVLCSVMVVSAQQTTLQVTTEKSRKTTDWTPKYKGEINLGYSIAGEKFKFEQSYESSDGEYSDGTLGKFNTDFSRPLFETVHGVEFGPYFFVGAGVGLQYYCGKLKEFQSLADAAAEINETKPSKRWNAVMLPIFADIKLMYPVNNNFTPFLNLALGGTVGCYSSIDYTSEESGYSDEYPYEEYDYEANRRARGGFYCDFGAGFRYKALNFSLGLQHQVLKLVNEYEDMGSGESFSEKQTIKTAVNSFYVKVGINF
jgi:hypothetical protein